MKTNQKSNKAYTVHSLNKINKFDIEKKNQFSRVNHQTNNLKNSLLNIKKQ